MAISSKTVAAVLITMMLLSTTCCFVQLTAATMSTHHYPCAGRRVLQVPAAATNKDTDSFPPTTPGPSPNHGHGSPPMTK
ncbi:unnamed protein product [Miscanthus lutarioriparius]|uniref:Uncharacterized protein n=1 Tax=Miscanthus lutarioriparius TaxID=422564 RepID=A0A811R092_9POAL|nr:unnamed protein product [Miscanthus lutarioriparius]